MAKSSHYEITIHLDTLQNLFSIDTEDQFSDQACYITGIDAIKEEIQPSFLRKKVKVTTRIVIPQGNIDREQAAKIKQAIDRYCLFQIKEHKKTIRTLTQSAMKELCAGVVFLICGLFLIDFFSKVVTFPPFLNDLLSNGFDIACWVSLWRPIDFFLFDLALDTKEEKVYECIMHMEFLIIEEEK